MRKPLFMKLIMISLILLGLTACEPQPHHQAASAKDVAMIRTEILRISNELLENTKDSSPLPERSLDHNAYRLALCLQHERDIAEIILSGAREPEYAKGRAGQAMAKFRKHVSEPFSPPTMFTYLLDKEGLSPEEAVLLLAMSVSLEEELTKSLDPGSPLQGRR